MFEIVTNKGYEDEQVIGSYVPGGVLEIAGQVYPEYMVRALMNMYTFRAV